MRIKTASSVLAFFILLQVPAFSSDTPSSTPTTGTQVMNSRGENMVIEFKLFDPGTETFIDYENYGSFVGLGTDKYAYKMSNRKGLAAAVGEGVYPNNSVLKDPVYRLLVPKGKLKGSSWDYVNIEDQQLTFYKWATTADTPGVQQFYTAMALEKLGQTAQAIKGYHAVMVHFPKAVGWTFWHTPLYMGKLAADRIDYLTRKHPELGIKLEGAEIKIENGFNFTINDDVFIINPGKLVKADPSELKPKRLDLGRLKVIKTVGTGRSQLVEFENHHWQMRVDGKPYMVKGIAYAPSPVGKSPNAGNLDPNNDWMTADLNKNGQADGPFDAWVDKNKNNQQDADEKPVGDFQLMKEMGVNTVRLYHHANWWPGFSDDEFKDSYTTKALLAAIADAKIGPLTGASDTEKLNNLLKQKGLRAKLPKTNLTKDADYLIKLENELDEGGVMKLNRYVVEAAFPKECPKRLKSKDLLRKLYKDYGINVIMGDMLGMYAAGSGAEWYKGTDYTNPTHLENMRKSVRLMVEEYKDEPYVLMWMLGNESNYGEVGDPDPKSNKAGLGSNAKMQPDAHYKFVNEVAGMIKSIDSTRPVGFSNGEVVTIDILSKYSDNIDIFGANVYRGSFGFGKSFWQDVRTYMDKPALFTEYGCPAYVTGKDQDYAEAKQVEYHQGNWEDIVYNSAGSGMGNAIGGVLFEYVDEWWKSGLPPKFSPSEHETIGDFTAAFPDGTMHEEWLGVASQGDGTQSPFLRQLRKSYDYYKNVWNEGK